MTEEIGGGVAIDKEIIPSQRDFFPTATEHLFKQAKQLNLTTVMGGGGVNTIYTVPSRHEFYICSITTSGVTSAVVSRIISIEVDTVGTLQTIFLEAGGVGVNTICYQFPFKLDENQVLSITGTDATVDGITSITGFLAKKSVV